MNILTDDLEYLLVMTMKKRIANYTIQCATSGMKYRNISG